MTRYDLILGAGEEFGDRIGDGSNLYLSYTFAKFTYFQEDFTREQLVERLRELLLFFPYGFDNALLQKTVVSHPGDRNMEFDEVVFHLETDGLDKDERGHDFPFVDYVPDYPETSWK